MALSAVAGMSQTIGEAFYIYRNDGMINTFFRSEIDSIAYSYYDADSLLYEEIVSQVVYTPDSIYKIPLAVIDSVGFVTPETKYQPNVIHLDGEIRNYIIGSDSLTIYFRSDTPNNILPKIGDKLVTTEMSEMFMGGFLGQVEAKGQKDETIALHCCAIGLEEAFECFYYSTNGMSQKETNKTRAARWEWNGYYAPDPFAFSFSGFLNANVKPIDCPTKFLKLPPKLDVTIAPTFQSKGSIIVHPLRGVIISIDIKQHTSLSQEFAVSGGVGVSHDFAPDIIPMYPILPFVSIYGEMGVFLKASANLSLEGHWNQSLDYNIHYQTSYLPPMTIPTTIPEFTISNVNLKTDHYEEFMLDGSVAGGLYGEVGIVPLYSKYIAKAGFRFEAGIELGGDVMLYNSDGENSLLSTSTYERLKAGELHVKTFCNVGLQAKLLDVGKGKVNLFKKEWDLAKFKLVPDFSNTTLTRDDDSPSTLWAATTASGSTIVPSILGFKLFEGEKDEGITGDNSHSYWNLLGYPDPYHDIFKSQSLMKSYTVFPSVNLFGIEMLAEPSAKIGICATPITLNVENIDETTATVWGKIVGCDLLDDTVEFGLGYREEGSTGSVSYNAHSLDENGMYSVEFMALKPNTNYKYFAYLIIDGETYFGEDKVFTTLDDKAEAYGILSEDGTLLTYYYDGKKNEREGQIVTVPYNYSQSIEIVSFDASFVKYKPTSTRYWFSGMSNLTSIQNIENLNTSEVTDMSAMFSGCSSLEKLNLSSFRTSSVTSFYEWFSGCNSLTQLDISNFDLSNIKSNNPFGIGLLAGLTSLRSITMNDFVFGNTAAYMFSGKEKLEEIIWDNVDTNNVTDMKYMFKGCSLLKSVDLYNFETKNVKDMNNMFYDCKSLYSLDVRSFNTSNVTNMAHMFGGCISLSSIDLENFDTYNVGSMRGMFANCNSLTKIYASDWNKISRVDHGYGEWDLLFDGCNKLEGEKGTKIGINYYVGDDGNTYSYECGTSLHYACVDGGKDNPGLFTAK